MIKISCIIAAYNEAARIADVLAVVSAHALVDEVIVVDDGSFDSTREVVAKFENVRLMVHEKNRGKSAAVHTGIAASAGEFIFLLDADLVGLEEKNITDLIDPVLRGRADMSMSLRGNSPQIWRMIGLDYISGDRVFPQKILAGHRDEILALPGFGLEVFLNRLAIKNHCRIKIVSWPHVASPYKSKKSGFWHGIKGDVRMMHDIFVVISPLESVWQIIRIMSFRI